MLLTSGQRDTDTVFVNRWIWGTDFQACGKAHILKGWPLFANWMVGVGICFSVRQHSFQATGSQRHQLYIINNPQKDRKNMTCDLPSGKLLHSYWTWWFMFTRGYHYFLVVETGIAGSALAGVEWRGSQRLGWWLILSANNPPVIKDGNGKISTNWSVIWNMNFITFHSVGNVIIPTEELHDFSRWWLNHQKNREFSAATFDYQRVIAMENHHVWKGKSWNIIYRQAIKKTYRVLLDNNLNTIKNTHIYIYI